jgi:HD-GYP domain-containing protein (c-di-GMP phosphodiesterase class II)
VSASSVANPPDVPSLSGLSGLAGLAGLADADPQRPPRRSHVVELDSYRSPEAETLLRSARERFSGRTAADRLLVTEGVGALLFLACALGLALIASPSQPLLVSHLAVAMVAYLCATRVRFPVAAGLTCPTQLVFVPMLFLLPVEIVPIVVAGCLVLDLWPDVPRGRVTLSRVLARVADASYALGPALVLVLAHCETFSWEVWPVLALAFAAQVGFDASSGVLRTWLADRILPRDQLPWLWLYAIDLCLSCAGLLVAASAVKQPGLVLLTLPMIAMLWLFARERQVRLDSTLELSNAYRGTALLLGDVIECDDTYTGTHSREVVRLALVVADRLEVSPSARLGVEFGALLHDVGKIQVPIEIIRKPGGLTADELATMRQHTIIGEAMLDKVGGTLSSVGHIVRATHEHYDGRGYPDRLAGEQIPIEARIIATCDAFNAMTTDRSYRSAMPPARAVEELRRCAGTQFDPRVVAALVLELGLV